jgi:3-hydroxyisobutyrate dehydrogenase
MGRQRAQFFQSKGPTVAKNAFSIARELNTRYGFIGLGRMGLPMAANLYRKGVAPSGDQHSLTVLDVSPEPYTELRNQLEADGSSTQKGSDPFKIANSIEELVTTSDFIVTMLPEPKHVADVYEKIVAALEKLPENSPDRIFVDCSTIDVETSLNVAKKLMGLSNGIKTTFVDAPVSGGTVGAANGTLTFMTGLPRPDAPAAASSPASAVPLASPAVVAEIESTLAHMGARVVPCGAPGLGLAAKLANNYILALNNVSTAEGFRLAHSLGLDSQLFADIVNTSTGRSWSTQINNPVPGVVPTAPASRNYENGFGLALMRKDLGLALEAAKQVAQPLLIGDATYAAYQRIEQEGGENYRGKDMSIIYQYLEK